jgi:hypothetical protein
MKNDVEWQSGGDTSRWRMFFDLGFGISSIMWAIFKNTRISLQTQDLSISVLQRVSSVLLGVEPLVFNLPFDSSSLIGQCGHV